jgi:hypothetical protein
MFGMHNPCIYALNWMPIFKDADKYKVPVPKFKFNSYQLYQIYVT